MRSFRIEHQYRRLVDAHVQEQRQSPLYVRQIAQVDVGRRDLRERDHGGIARHTGNQRKLESLVGEEPLSGIRKEKSQERIRLILVGRV